MNFLRPLESRPRLAISLLFGIAVYALAKRVVPSSIQFIVGFDSGMACFLGLTWFMIVNSSLHHLRKRAAQEDVGRWAILAILVGVAYASLFSIAKLLSKSAKQSAQLELLHVSFSVVTILLSWFLIHTLYTLTYAHVYYGLIKPPLRSRHKEQPAVLVDPAQAQVHGGLDFPGDEEPEYLDFAYFSLVVGMTCQTSDVGVTTRYMRKVVLFHSVVTFFFNTTIVALTINLLAGLLN